MTDNIKDTPHKSLVDDALRLAKEALKPFAEAYNPKIYTTSDDPEYQAITDRNEITPSMTMGDFRRAHEIYNALTSPDPKEAAQDEREMFERACAENGFDFDRVDALSPLAWQSWQWRAALSAQSVREQNEPQADITLLPHALSYVREQALEAAAKACENLHSFISDPKIVGVERAEAGRNTLNACAAAIRALSSQPAQKEAGN